MFSGIITDTAEILHQETVPAGLKLTFRRPSSWKDLNLGESIATNGVCLTVDGLSKGSYSATLIPETLQVTSFGKNIPGRVNLERSLKVGDRLSGHFVQGHVDDTGNILAVDKADGYRLWISYSPQKQALLVEKGSIVVDGVALTVSELKPDRFSVALVPFTLANTTLAAAKKGNPVNLEYDVLGKYIVNEARAHKE